MIYVAWSILGLAVLLTVLLAIFDEDARSLIVELTAVVLFVALVGGSIWSCTFIYHYYFPEKPTTVEAG